MWLQNSNAADRDNDISEDFIAFVEELFSVKNKHSKIKRNDIMRKQKIKKSSCFDFKSTIC